MINDLENKISAFRDTFSCEAKNAINNKEFIMNYCLKNRAWKDTVIREKFIKESEVIKNKDNIIAILKNELVNNTTVICDDFDKWHDSLCSNNSYGMKYGLWQKFINMTFKNLFCVKTMFCEFDSIWDKCHCPIDTIISKSIYEQLKEMGVEKSELELSYKISQSDKEINWNNISQENYKKLQKQIGLICEDSITPLQFDFLFWEN